MQRTDDLAKIRGGDASLAEARAILEHATSDAARAPAIYAALRAWTWKALRGRRQDGELSGWHRLLRAVAARLSMHDPALSERIETLGELVFETVRFADANPTDEVLARDHVREILDALRTAPGCEIARPELIRLFGLKQANLSRVLAIMEGSGLVERETRGRVVYVRLPAGERAARARTRVAWMEKPVRVGRRIGESSPAVAPGAFALGRDLVNRSVKAAGGEPLMGLVLRSVAEQGAPNPVLPHFTSASPLAAAGTFHEERVAR